MVLQQAPARAAVYGTVRLHAPPHVAVRVVASREYTVRAIVSPSPCGSGCHEAGCGQLAEAASKEVAAGRLEARRTRTKLPENLRVKGRRALDQWQ